MPPATARRVAPLPNRARHEFFRRDDRIDQTAFKRSVDVESGAGVEQLRQVPCRHRKTHRLERDRGKGHPDQKLGHTDAAIRPRHDAAVGTAGEHAAAGNGVTVDGRHNRLREKEQSVKCPVQRRMNLRRRIRSAGTLADEIDPGAEIRPCPVITTAQAADPAIRAKQFPALRCVPRRARRLAVLNGDNGYAVVGFQIDHGELIAL